MRSRRFVLAMAGFVVVASKEVKTRFVRADEVRVGQLIWQGNAEHAILRVRDLSDGRLELTLQSHHGDAVEVKLAPWAQLPVIDG